MGEPRMFPAQEGTEVPRQGGAATSLCDSSAGVRDQAVVYYSGGTEGEKQFSSTFS